MTLSEKLQKIMDAKGIQAIDLAKISGVPTSRISEIVTGKTKNPQLKTLMKLSDALGCSFLELTSSTLLTYTPGCEEKQEEPIGEKLVLDDLDKRILSQVQGLTPEQKRTVEDIVSDYKLVQELKQERAGKKAA